MKKRKKQNPYEKPRERYVASAKYIRPPFEPMKTKVSRFPAAPDYSHLPSAPPPGPHPNLHTSRVVYEDDAMKLREEAAQVEKARKAKMVAPLSITKADTSTSVQTHQRRSWRDWAENFDLVKEMLDF